MWLSPTSTSSYICIYLAFRIFQHAIAQDDQESNNNAFKQVYQQQVNNRSPWSGCVDPNNTSYENNLVTLGKKTTLCIVVSNGGNWGAQTRPYSRWVFQPTADEYSHFTVAQSYNDLVKETSNFYYPQVSIHVESQQQLSFIRRYFDDTDFENKIFPRLTAIVAVKQGVVTGITWDDACIFCESERCEENTYDFSGQSAAARNPPLQEPTKGCFLTKMECDSLLLDPSTSKHNECSLNIYFVWTGTDKNGKVLQSANSRYSLFPRNRIPRFEDYVPNFNVKLFRD